MTTPTPQPGFGVRRLRVSLIAMLSSAIVFAQETKPADDSASEPKKDEPIVLSPFSVDASKDIGYYAANTLAGSRLNTNVGDLASSITVVTKQQLEDTGALDINDVFMYEANTEGANSYTPVALNRNNITDNIGGYSGDDGSPFGIATANRVRGLGRVDTAQNNHPTIARWAFDSYNTNSVEISRGPNSLLFGTGSPAGIVNQSTSEAALGKNHTTVSARFGSFGAKRASIGTNVALGKHFAVYAAALWDDREFQRKPSYDEYRRQYIAATFQPWSKTKITASFENYENRNSRPNFLPPQDRVTPWINAGRPGWNPVTQRITYQDGRITQPYLLANTDPRFISAAVTPVGDGALTSVSAAGVPGPFYVPGIQFIGNRQIIRVDNGQPIDFWVQNTLSGGAAPGLPAAAARTAQEWVISSARLTQSAGFLTPIPPASTGATGYGSWLPLHVTDKSIYDWERYNVSGANFGTQHGKTYNVEFQQELLENLHFSAGWFRQQFDEWDHYGLGQANQAPRLYVDTNTHNLNGEVNPYFGAPYVLDSQADSFFRPEKNDNLRALLAYTLDFTKRDGWTRWLGNHRFLGLVSRQDQWTNNLRYRLSYQGGDQRFLPAAANIANGSNSWAGNAANIQRFYYVGKNGIVDHGVDKFGTPGFEGQSTFPLKFYDWNTRSFGQTDMQTGMNLFYAGGNYGVNKRRTDSRNFAWQSYLWKNRIIPTLGWRTDTVDIAAYSGRTADGSRALVGADQYAGGFGVQGLWNNLGPKRTFKGDTTTRGVVVRPFSDWAPLDSRAASGNVLADFVRGLSFHYNESDNFNAPAGLQVDYFNRPLAPPTGKGKDYGVGVSMFNNKLVVRLNWYEASNNFASSPAANTVVGRAQRMDTNGTKRWAEYIVRIQDGQDPRTDLEFHNNTVHPLSQGQQDRIAALQWGSFKLGNYNWPDTGTYNGSIVSTESNISKGKELEIIYNPLRNWNMKLTVGQQRAQYSNAGPEVKEWLAFRKPQWEALTAAGAAALPAAFQGEVIKANGNRLNLSSFWTGYGFTEGSSFNDAPSDRNGGTGSMSATYTSIVESVYYPMVALENTKSSNLREWEAKYITNYAFQTGRLKGVGIGASVRWQDKAIAGYYGLTDPSTYAHPTATTANIVFPDLNRPIYTPSETNLDLWVSYSRRMFNDKTRMKIQLNVRDATESGGLQAIGFNPDGSAAQYRIKDPRTWFVTTTFDF